MNLLQFYTGSIEEAVELVSFWVASAVRIRVTVGLQRKSLLEQDFCERLGFRIRVRVSVRV